MKGLIIKEHWVDLILKGEKVWEIRSSPVHNIRGRIALIQSGTKTIVGYADLVDSIHIPDKDFSTHFKKHQVPDDELSYKKSFAWVLENAVRLPKPIPYDHPHGVVIWVNLPDDILDAA